MAVKVLFILNNEHANVFYEKKIGRSTACTQVFSCIICEAFCISGGCFWKNVTHYYVIKNM